MIDELGRELAVSRILSGRDSDPEREERYAREALRLDLGSRLVSALGDGGHYSVRIVEERRPGLDPYRGDMLILRAEVRRVEVRRPVMWAPPHYAVMPPKDVSLSAVDELKRRARRAVGRWFGSKGQS